MALWAGGQALAYCKLYRVVWMGGRYGGGKTALAFRLAHDLLKNHGYRYLLSNVKSVWTDDPKKIVLRDGQYADAVVILDEGGLFLKSSKDAETFLAFLRKLNVVILIPSVTPPTLKVRSFTIQRVYNLYSYGLPAWVYRWTLSSGHIKETGLFYWVSPPEIFGVYDTLGTPSDDGGLEDIFNDWTVKLQKTAGYTAKGVKQAPVNSVSFSFGTQAEGSNSGQQVGGAPVGEVSRLVNELRSLTNDIQDAQEEISDRVSVFQSSSKKKRGRKR